MSWLDNYSTTNTFRSMYINGFIDISGGRLQTRSVTDGHLFIAGDTSLNGNLYVGGDISWNPNSLANNSIPSSAIIGGVGGTSGPADVLLLDATNHTSTANYGISQIDYKIYGSGDMLADPYVKRFNHTETNNKTYRGFCMLFKPGIYRFTTNYRVNLLGAVYFSFDLDNDHQRIDDPIVLADTNIASHESVSFNRSYVVPHVSNFYFVEHTNVSIYDYPNNYIQMKFERIGDVEPSGTDDTLSILSGGSSSTLTDTKLIEGGIYWNSSTSNPPPTGYYPSDHTSQGGTNEWAVVEQAAGTVQNVLAWVHRIDTNSNSNSSVEVASFHSDADLSLNKRLFVGEDVTLNKRLFVGEDISLNGNLYVGGDISWNPTSLANDSIPSSAIITEFMILNATNHTNTNTSGMTQMDYEILGSTDMLADSYCLRGYSSSKSYRSLNMLFHPGIYKITLNCTRNYKHNLWFGFDLDNDDIPGIYSNGGENEEPMTLSNDPNQVTSITRVFAVYHKANFGFLEAVQNTFFNYPNAFPQIIFERIGHVVPSGTDGTLTVFSTFSITDTKLINGGIYW